MVEVIGSTPIEPTEFAGSAPEAHPPFAGVIGEQAGGDSYRTHCINSKVKTKKNKLCDERWISVWFCDTDRRKLRFFILR